MEAKKLRIGNLILFPTQADNGLLIPSVVRKVDAIGFGNVISLNPPTYPTNFDAHIKNCMGIKLTKEWFIKLGFRWSDNYNWYEHKKPYVVFKEDFTLLEKPFRIEIKLEYVHELQNLFFALTGTELELKDECSTCG